MPSPSTTLRTARVQASGWSRRRAGTAIASCAWAVSRLPVRTRGPAGSSGAGGVVGQYPVAGPEGGRRELDRLLVPDVAGDRNHGVRRPVHRGPEVTNRRGRQRPDAGFVATDLAAQRPLAEHRLLDQHLAVLGGVVEVRADLLDDDRALLVDVGVGQARLDDELAQDVHRGRGLAPRDPGPVHRRLAVGRGIRRPADPLDRLRDRARRRIARVPLNVRCSMKWATPASASVSRREPART